MSFAPFQRFCPRDYDLFVGLDVDKRSLSVTFLDHRHGQKSMRIPYSAEHLLQYTRRHFSGLRTVFAYEAGCTGFGLHDHLSRQGLRCLVVSPSQVPRSPNEQVKTNRLDSQKIAESLRGGQLKPIHVPSTPYRHLRQLVQLRDTAVGQVVAAKNRIKALLLLEGLPFPGQGSWTLSALARLKELACAPPIRFKLDQLLSTLIFARQQVLKVQKEIRRFCRQDPELDRCLGYLRSVPGIGWITASHFLARVGDWRQLGNVRQTVSFLGLVPREDSTGDRHRRGGITRWGDGRLSAKIIESSWRAIRIDPELREFYHVVYQRHPRHYAGRKAIVAVARKLGMRLHVVLKEQRPYQMRPDVSIPLTQEEIFSPRARLA